MLWLERALAPTKPLVATSVVRARDHLASAPSELVILGMGERCFLGDGGLSGQRLGGGLLAVVQIQARKLTGDLIGVGDPGVGVFGHRPRDRDRPLDQPVQARPPEVAGGHDRLPPADEHAQAEIAALRALDVVELAQAPGGRLAAAFDQEGIRGIGAGPAGPRQQCAQKIDGVVGTGHRGGSPPEGTR